MSNLSKSLSQFITNNEKSQFDDPFDDNESSIDVKAVFDKSSEHKEEKKKRKKDKFSKVMDRGNELMNDFMNDDIIDDFDGYIGGFLLDDEDSELKRNLLRYGRKYARETKVSGETSEINKAYSESEKLLSELLKEIDEDKELVQKDITSLRMMRTRNFKTLSDLIESKAQFHNTALSVIKEMNSMKKNQFELQMKADRASKEEAADESESNRAIQRLFGVGRDNIMSGGYADISGASDAGFISDDDSYNSVVDEDEIIQQQYFNNDEEESDGDKFLKYEGRGVQYILLYDDNNAKEIIAEDRDGNIIPDYPIPGDPNELEFNISESTGTATDNLANQYQLRKM